jgi:hypothetical protein
VSRLVDGDQVRVQILVANAGGLWTVVEFAGETERVSGIKCVTVLVCVHVLDRGLCGESKRGDG